jgi:RNA polymerase sigma-70 factor (ECF subfamily)
VSSRSEEAIDPTHAALVRLVRDEGTRVLATLIRLTGSVQLAEDAVQDAVVGALGAWPRDGVPDVPRAWLTAAARRRAIDVLRRENRRGAKEIEAVGLLGVESEPDENVVQDDLLRLVFTCCHPALSLDAQVALALRTLCGLTTAEVARALLVPEATMLKRLTRAKQKIARAGIPYRVPAAHELPDRVSGVAASVYLVFNEGYVASAGADAVRIELVDQAVRLGRLLTALLPDEPALIGLLALMLLQDSRRATRVDAEGHLVLLTDQDRARWDPAKIREGVSLVGEGLRRSPARPDAYVVQAAIAACHALAPSLERTDWPALVSWYDVLLTVHDTPVVRLNRAVALGERDGPEAGLAAVEALTGLAGYPWWQASRAELLWRLGRGPDAGIAWRNALALETNLVTRRHLKKRLAQLGPDQALSR